MQTRFRVLIAAGVVVLFTILLVLASGGHSGPRILARSVSPDGVEMYVLQQPNWGNWANVRGFLKDPWFTTRFVVRTRDGAWKIYYYSHEDTYWLGGGRFVLDTNGCRAVVYRGKDAVIRFQWDTGIYHITRPYADGTARAPSTVQAQGASDQWIPRPSRHEK